MAGFSVKNKKKKTITWIVLGAAALVILVLLLLPKPQAKPELAFAQTTVLEKKDFQNTVSASGVVESSQKHKIYSTQAYPVAEVLVEVGDRVEPDTLLCRLDAGALEDQIAARQTASNVSARAAQQQLTAAQDNYNAAKNAVEGGENSTLISAQTALDNAEAAYERALRAYENYEQTLDDGLNATLLAQESALERAEDALDAAEDALDDAYDRLDAAQTEEEQAKAEAAVQAAEAQYDAAEDAYDAAEQSYEAAELAAEQALEDYAFAADNAWMAYEAAQRSYDAAAASVQTGLQSSYNAVISAQIGADNSVNTQELERLRQDLAETEIYAGAAGTVTAVFADVGASGAGLLFVIEDTEDLVVETSVEEYDVDSIKENMKVIMQPQTNKENTAEGHILSIAPTVTKDAVGNTASVGSGEFAVKVKVDSSKTPLRIGTSVRLDYILEEHKNVLSVPYDAVYTNEEGTDCVIVVEETEEGFFLHELPVTAGAYNALDRIISGTGVEEGLRVVNDADAWRDKIGTQIDLRERVQMGFPFAMQG